MSSRKDAKIVRHFFEYLGVLSLYGLIKLIPRRMNTGAGKALAQLARFCTKRRVFIASENLRQSIPDYPPEHIETTVRTLYLNLALNTIDAVHARRAVSSVRLADEDRELFGRIFDEANQGKPYIFATGHFGAWDLLVRKLGMEVRHLSCIIKPQSNPYVNRWLDRIRMRNVDFEAKGSLIPSTQAHRLLPKAFKSGGSVIFNTDQDGGGDGLFVDFFGRPASFFKGLGIFSAHFGVPVVMTFIRRENDRHTLFIDEVFTPSDNAEHNCEVTRLVRAYAASLERVIRKYPDQWLWTHRRWKTRPKVETPQSEVTGFHSS